jgi:hypothetical protein
MPRDFISRADHAVERHGGDGFEMAHYFIPDQISRIR